MEEFLLREVGSEDASFSALAAENDKLLV